MNKKRKAPSIILLIIIAAVTAFLSLTGLFRVTMGDYRMKTFGEQIVKGLDLQGGTSVLLEVQAPDLKADGLERVRALIHLRVDATGAVDPTITTEGTNRIRVDIPGKFQSGSIVDQLSKTGILTFKDETGTVVLQGTDIKEASPSYDELNRIVVLLRLKPEGVQKFAEATTKNVGKRISINMDDKMLSNPTVNEPIRDGSASITGQSTIEEAKMLAAMINNGALPYPVKVLSVQEIGATLGSSVLPNVKWAGIFGIIAIFIVMLWFYRIPGLLSSLALAIFCLGLVYITAALKISMSLAGIAGFLLTIGMAVDANVLIFERIKEEMASGLDTKRSIGKGFSQAMSSILDANITTLISGFILYYFGAGSVRGFALNLVIGVLLSMFTAIIVTRLLMTLAYNAGLLNTKGAFGFKESGGKKFNFQFFKRRNVFFILSAVVIASGLVVGAVRGANVGIDFAGGTQVTLNFPTTIDKPAVDQVLKKYDDGITTQVVSGTKMEIRSNKLDTVGFDKPIKELKEQYKGDKNFVDSISEIGAAIGSEQTGKAVLASVLSVLAILIYVAIRFKFTLGVGAIVALVHDVLFTLSMYFLFYIPINSPFIAAILTIIGYSINDTVVIFDRIRENLATKGSKKLEDVTDTSISQTMLRTINTSLTVLVILVVVYFMVPQIRDFTLPLLLGTVSGVYSTVFIASPIYVMLEKKFGKNKNFRDAASPHKAVEGEEKPAHGHGPSESLNATKSSTKTVKEPVRYSNRYTKARSKAGQASEEVFTEQDLLNESTQEKEVREIPLADDFRFSKTTEEKLKKIHFDEDEL
ncbi:Protein-export membrane protein SecD [Clostridiaceae bacterium JG1575]|nr:Protein-export membrane protein SecD [Clostridiaceae bacterium JG1575]